MHFVAFHGAMIHFLSAFCETHLSHDFQAKAWRRGTLGYEYAQLDILAFCIIFSRGILKFQGGGEKMAKKGIVITHYNQ